ncbi:LytR/AlgR family response regulator transcription factor [Sphingobacterium kitahiroshimense]|uniref:LytTR family DNA-binding domain-containing protein n=1 Tax=Sphingobacterium kitahiroshimense TaxID=470446 RepID=A0ABV0BWR8_9SPHI
MLNKISVIIIGDKPLPRTRLSDLLKKISGLEFLGTFENSAEVYEMVKTTKIDLIFSDIHLLGMNGIGFLKSLADPPFVVFVTEDPTFAVEAFELDVLDYILKPQLSLDRVRKSIDKVRKAIGSQLSEKKQEYIRIKDGHKTFFLNSEDILYVNAYGDYVKLFTEKRVELKLKTMKEMEQCLPKKYFIRVHRSFMINILAIESIDMTKVILKGVKGEIPIGSKYRPMFFQKVGMVE